MSLMQKMIIEENVRVAHIPQRVAHIPQRVAHIPQRVAHIPQIKQKYLKYLSIFDNWDTQLSLLILTL